MSYRVILLKGVLPNTKINHFFFTAFYSRGCNFRDNLFITCFVTNFFYENKIINCQIQIYFP